MGLEYGKPHNELYRKIVYMNCKLILLTSTKNFFPMVLRPMRIGYRISFRIENEISELIFGNIIWIGALSKADAEWSIKTYTDRKNIKWSPQEIDKIIEFNLEENNWEKAEAIAKSQTNEVMEYYELEEIGE